MDNKTIYKKTIGFSVRRLLWDILAALVFVGASAIGFLAAENASNQGLIGLAIGAVIGLILVVIMLRFVSYTYKAGQIAMMTKAITDDKLPDDVIGEGKKIVRGRFTTIAAYFAVTGVIKGIFNQIGRGITAVGEAVGGDAGGTVGSTISAAIQTVVAYLCDCCLGWVFYRKDESSTKATCEGAVLFFKHGKTLAKNLGRIFGMGLVSFVVVGGIFFGLAWLIMQAFAEAFANLSAEIMEAGTRIGSEIPAWASDPGTLIIVCAALAAIALWSFLHSAFVRPFILVGVLRNYIDAGINDIPTEEAFDELDGKSKKFKELHAKLES